MTDFRGIFKESFLAEGSYTDKDIPKRFYLAINFSLWDPDVDQKLDNLLKGELIGVKGVGGTSIKEMLKDWGGMREVMMVMPSADVLKINKLSRIMYDNPEYLVSNGMKALRRLFNDTDDTYTSIFTKMQGYIVSSMKDKEDAKAGQIINYYGAINSLDHDHMKELKAINSIADLCNFIMKFINDDTKYLKSLPFAWWRKVVTNGLIKMGSTFSGEKEWAVKDGILRVPKSTRMYAVESIYFKEEYEKSISDNKMTQYFANKGAVAKYLKWVELIKKLQTGYKVEIVPEQYVEKKKKDLLQITGRLFEAVYNQPDYARMSDEEHNETVYQSDALKNDPVLANSLDPAIVRAIHEFAKSKSLFLSALSKSKIQNIHGKVANSEFGMGADSIEDKDKVNRVGQLLDKGIDRPIIIRHHGNLYLLAGNTRATMVGQGVEAHVIDV